LQLLKLYQSHLAAKRKPFSRKDAKAQRKGSAGSPLRLGAFARYNSR
jgi:hypothetical protein